MFYAATMAVPTYFQRKCVSKEVPWTWQDDTAVHILQHNGGGVKRVLCSVIQEFSLIGLEGLYSQGNCTVRVLELCNPYISPSLLTKPSPLPFLIPSYKFTSAISSMRSHLCL